MTEKTNPHFTKEERTEAIDICAMAIIKELFKTNRISYDTYQSVINDMNN